MLFKPAFIAAFLAAVATAAPSPSGYTLHEKRDAPLKRWTRLGPVNSEARLPMRIGMVQSNFDDGERLAMEVSDHTSPKYSKWYSAEEIVEMFAPPQKAVDEIRDWLESSGIEPHRISQSANKQWIQFDALPSEAESLLKTKYHVYQHKATGKINVACEEYHLPKHISNVVDYVTPGLKLLSGAQVTDGNSDLFKRGFGSSGHFQPPLLNGAAPNLAGLTDGVLLGLCDEAVTPVCIKTMYNITDGTLAAANNQLGIFEEGDYLSQTDLSEFLTLFELGRIPTTTAPKVDGVDGGTIPGPTPGAESDLDFQISIPIIYPQGTILFQSDDLPYATGLQPGNNGAFNTFLDAIDGSYCSYIDPLDPTYPDPSPAGYKGQLQCGVYKPTNVISVSYGLQEDDLPLSYITRQCKEYMKLGMQGTSVVFASGDSGVSARSTDDNNADGCLGTGQVFNPDYPASCPWVTSVGATYLPPGAKAQGDQEVAVTRFPSGGGFSNAFVQPSYQSKAVSAFLTRQAATSKYPSYPFTTPTNNPTAAQYGSGIFNRGGRGYPDVSAIGDNVVIVLDGMPTLIGGTSAAAPVFAAILTRINEERIKVGKKSVGFVNPVLYSNPWDFHDITVGNNSGCGTAGFLAGPGWDPLTGLGTPNYPALLKTFLALA